MRNFFSCLAVNENSAVKLYFTNSDSHEAIIEALGLKDDRLIDRLFVRLECQPPFERVVVDEQCTVPDWFDVVKIFPRVRRLARKVNTLYEQYKAQCKPLYEQYEAQCARIKGYVAPR